MASQNETDFATTCDLVVADFESAIVDASRRYEQFLQLALELRYLAEVDDLSPDRAADFHARIRKATRLCKGKNFDRLKDAAETLVQRVADLFGVSSRRLTWSLRWGLRYTFDLLQRSLALVPSR